MALSTTDPTTTQAWKKLSEHYQHHKHKPLRELFAADPQRAKKFAVLWQDFLVDYSKNHITEETRSLLVDLAHEMELPQAISTYFRSNTLNLTEGRAVLHTALRAQKEEEIYLNGKNIVTVVSQVKQKIQAFTQAVHAGQKKGFTHKPFTDVVNVGIGGSDLGPVMVTEALKYYKTHLNTHFISNVDGDHVHETLQHLDPETTLCIIVSKSFTTQETRSNALTLKKWFLQKAPKAAIAQHFVAVSTNLQSVQDFGIAAENIFPMWDWVGGRFSLWSAVGLSIALAIGYTNFEALLSGAHQMDRHFKTAPFTENIPVLLALISIWYNNFFGAQTEAIIPYTHYLHRFPAYLQQAVMESNGKSTDRAGNRVAYQTGTIIWGEPGTNAQHAFFQLLHQGTKLIPTDFIGFKESLHGDIAHHNKLMANFVAQTEALMHGKTHQAAARELQTQNQLSKAQKEALLPFKRFEGNKPTNTLLIRKLTPKNLGALIALYEHKIFVQGVIWNIFSYDQWGVELGKHLAKHILSDMENPNPRPHDSSTLQLLHFFKQ